MRAQPPGDIDDPNAASPLRRDDFGTILDELAFLREQLARLPTRAEVR